MDQLTTTIDGDTPRSTRITRRVATASAGILVGLLSACAPFSTDGDAGPTSAVAAPTTVAPAAPSSVPTTDAITEPAVPSSPTRAISQVGALTVVDEPGSANVVAELSASTDFGSTRVLLVEKVVDGWVRVHLPVRPNGTTGWVPADSVRLETLQHTVTVDLEARSLTVWMDGQALSTSTVAIGSPENPTPTGSFYIIDKIDTSSDGSAYGPFALGLSAHSDTLSEFGGGDGQIGLHGTNDPSSIGNAVSHGCVRLPNDVITQLATDLPLGTPVVIT